LVGSTSKSGFVVVGVVFRISIIVAACIYLYAFFAGHADDLVADLGRFPALCFALVE
jgi:hypothetical protein